MIKKKYTVETWEVYKRRYEVFANDEEQAVTIVQNKNLKHGSEIEIDFDILEVDEHYKDEWKLDI